METNPIPLLGESMSLKLIPLQGSIVDDPLVPPNKNVFDPQHVDQE